MKSFKEFLIENYDISPDDIYLSPKTIYNFYFLYTYSQTRGTDQFSDFLIKEFAQNIKKTYMRVFSNLIIRQLEKYQSRGRVDDDFKITETNSTTLHKLMQKTFRSDMRRRNDRWIELTKWVVALDNAKTFKDIFFAVDRINNTTHNTEEIILSKFSNADTLMDIFDRCNEFKSLDEFRPFITKEYIKLLLVSRCLTYKAQH
jgi:hypothetical protein